MVTSIVDFDALTTLFWLFAREEIVKTPSSVPSVSSIVIVAVLPAAILFNVTVNTGSSPASWSTSATAPESPSGLTVVEPSVVTPPNAVVIDLIVPPLTVKVNVPGSADNASKLLTVTTTTGATL